MKNLKITIVSLFLGSFLFGCGGDSFDEISNEMEKISAEKSNADGGNTSDEPPVGP